MPDAKDFFGAYLSDAELAVISAGLDAIEMEYFDRRSRHERGRRAGPPHGGSLSVPTGTWLVNCTG